MNNERYAESERWNARQNFRSEMLFVNQNIHHMYNYFQEKGMRIHVVGRQSFVDSRISRISLDELYEKNGELKRLE